MDLSPDVSTDDVRSAVCQGRRLAASGLVTRLILAVDVVPCLTHVAQRGGDVGSSHSAACRGAPHAGAEGSSGRCHARGVTPPVPVQAARHAHPFLGHGIWGLSRLPTKGWTRTDSFFQPVKLKQPDRMPHSASSARSAAQERAQSAYNAMLGLDALAKCCTATLCTVLRSQQAHRINSPCGASVTPLGVS